MTGVQTCALPISSLNFLISIVFADILLDDPSLPVDPTVYLWTLYFLALHYSTPLSPNTPPPNPSRSLDLLQRAIEHTPTLPELLMGKARVRPLIIVSILLQSDITYGFQLCISLL